MTGSGDRQRGGWRREIKSRPELTKIGGSTTSNADVAAAAKRGHRVLMSPANRVHLDREYGRSTKLGLDWAGYVEVKDAYGCNPGAYLSGVGESTLRGVEAPLWTETVSTSADIGYMAFPRLPDAAELGWTPASAHDWNNFAPRLGPLEK